MKCTTKGCLEGSEYFFHTPSILAKELFYYMDVCGHIYCGNNYRIRRETYSDYLLMYVVKGRLDVENEGEFYSVYPQQVVWMNCHHPHAYSSIDGTEFWYVHFDGGNCDKIYKYVKRTIGIITSAENDSQILEPLKLLVSRCKYHRCISEIEVTKQLYTIICNIIFMQTDNEIQKHGENPMIQQVMDYISEHYAEELSLDYLSTRFRISPYHLSHLFKKYTQQSLHEFLISTRLDKAKYLLTTTQMPISDIAFEVGYNSDTGFINAFSKRIGISPRKFRIYFN